MPRPLIFENRDFLKVWLGQVLSQSGTRMYQIAIVWWLVSAPGTDAGKIAAFFLVLVAIPSVLFVGIIGRLVDSYRTRSVLLVADALNTLVVGVAAAVLLSHPHAPVWLVYTAGFLSALLQAVSDPGFNKAVPEIVAPSRIEAATAFQASTISIGFFLGASAGALLIPVVGAAGVVALNAVSYLISFLCIASARFRRAPERPPVGSVDAPKVSPWRALDDYPRFRRLLFGMSLANFFTVPTFVILPLYVRRALGADAATLGWIESGIWLGIMAGTVASRRWRFTEDPERLGAACCLVLALGLAAPGVVVSAPFFFAMAVLQGFSFSFLPVRFIALFHAGVAPEVKGRFFALMSAMLSGALPISQFAAGALADWLPITRLCLIQGAGALLVSVCFLMPRRVPMPALDLSTGGAVRC